MKNKFIQFSIFFTPALLCLLYIAYFGVNIPYWDQWEFVFLLERHFAGELHLDNFTALHNEHRLFFPRLMMFLLFLITEYNILAELYLNWLLLVSSVMLLLYSYFSIEKHNSYKTYFVLLPLLFLAFGFQQWENLLWGWQIAIFLALLMFISTFYFLFYGIEKQRYFIFALLTAFIGSFSFGNTLSIWGIGGGLLIWLAYKQKLLHSKSMRVKFFIWGISFLLVLSLYFYNFNLHSAHSGEIGHFSFSQYFIYILSFLGNVLATPDFQSFALYIGAMIIIASFYALYLFFRLNKIEAYHVISTALIIFMLLSVSLIAIGRAEFGVEQAFSSRYTTFTTFGILGIFIILFTHWFKQNQFLSINISIGLLMISVVNTTFYGIDASFEHKERLEKIKINVENYRAAAMNDLAAAHPLPSYVRALSHTLSTNKISIFSDKNDEIYQKNEVLHLPPNFRYSVTINQNRLESSKTFNLSRDQKVDIEGWVIDTENQQTVKQVTFIIDDTLQIPLISAIPRNDVAKYFSHNNYLYSGINKKLHFKGASKKTYHVKVQILDKHGKTFLLPNNWYITLI